MENRVAAWLLGVVLLLAGGGVQAQRLTLEVPSPEETEALTNSNPFCLELPGWNLEAVALGRTATAANGRDEVFATQVHDSLLETFTCCPATFTCPAFCTTTASGTLRRLHSDRSRRVNMRVKRSVIAPARSCAAGMATAAQAARRCCQKNAWFRGRQAAERGVHT